MKLHKRRFLQPARVELLPLIDVIFLLLIFFIFVMLKMTIQSDIKVELPQVVSGQQVNTELITISIDADNQMFVNEQPSNSTQFLKQVQELQQVKEHKILIRGDKQADLGLALALLDQLRVAGFKQVAFATEQQ